MGLATSISKAYLKSGATKTDVLLAKGAKGDFNQAGEVGVKPPEVKVDINQPPVKPPKNNQVAPLVDEPDQAVKQAEAITEPKELEMGRPSARDPKARNINFDNITDSDEVLTIIDNIGEQNKQFVDARGGVVSHKQTLKDSAKVELEQILGFKLGDGVSPSRITGARIALQDSADRLKTMATQVLSGDATTAQKLIFRQAVSTHVGIQQAVAGMAAESGRSLNAWRIPIGVDTGSKTAVFRTQLQEAFDRSGGDNAAMKLAEMIDQAEDLLEVSKAASKVHKATSGDMMLEYWINGLLSSPATHSVNITSNAMVALWAIPERMLAAGISRVLRSKDGVQVQEALGQLYGIIYGARDGFRMFVKAVITGEPTDPAMKLEARQYRSITSENVNQILKNKGLSAMETEGYLAKGIDLLGSVLRTPGRLLGAEDEFFKSIGYRMELNALAYRKAVGEGLEGDDLAKRIVDLIENPTEELHIASVQMGRLQTFTNPLGDAGQKIQQLANAHPVLKLIIPFVRTPVNIVKFVGVRSPLAPLAKSFRADLAAGGARRDMALSKMAIGSLVMMIGASLTAEGVITGGGPRNKSQRDAMRRQGWQPYSIKVGDQWYSFNRTDPLGMFLGLAADVTETMKYANDKDASEIATASVMALAKNLTSRTYLRGVSDLMNVLSDPDRYAESFFRRQGASFTPMTSLVANIERYFDPTMRATYTLMEQIISRTPGLSDSLPPRRNLWGEPIVLEGGLGWDFISPIYSSTIKDDFVNQQIIDNEVNVSMPRRSVGSGNFSIKLNGEEYDRYIVLAGKELKLDYTNSNTGTTKEYGLHGYLLQIMKSDMYIEATEGQDGGKAVMIKIVVNAFRGSCNTKGCSGAIGQLLEEFPALKEEWMYQKVLKYEAISGEKWQ